jgi:DNA-binding response OmpR family regulator
VAVVTIIEDDARIRQAIATALEGRGHLVRSASTGMTGLKQVIEDPPEVVVLDLGLPDISGLELLRMLRAVSSVPVIVATAQDRDEQIVDTLDAGADDYVVKPYSAEQLDARIRAVLRRSGTSEARGCIEVGGLRIDPATHEARLDGDLLDLTPKEFELLAYLAANHGQVVSKRQLLADLWRQPYGGADKTIDVHLSWLRRKMGESAAEPRYLHTIRGVGVKLVEPGA